MANICPGCGVSFETTHPTKKFHHPSCQKSYNTLLASKNIIYERLCPHCGVRFSTKQSNKIYHSVACQRDAVIKRQHAPRVLLPPLEPDAFKLITIKSALNGARVVIFGDCQIPYHDVRVLGAISRFMRDWQPNVLVLLGDIWDAYEISDFDRSPLRATNLKDELEEVKHWLRIWRDDVGPDADIYFIEGNHEQRWERYLTRKAPELAGLDGINLASLLCLKKLDITMTSYGGGVDYLGFRITHGHAISNAAPAAGMSARKAIIRRGGSGIMGHTHRLGSVSYTSDTGTHRWLEAGCTCLIPPPNYGIDSPDWQHGLVYGEVHNNRIHLHQVAIYSDGFWAANKFWAL